MHEETNKRIKTIRSKKNISCHLSPRSKESVFQIAGLLLYFNVHRNSYYCLYRTEIW